MTYEFDLEQWLTQYQLGDIRHHYRKSGANGFITGPSQICNMEVLRRHMRDLFDWGTPVPVDLFIMATGEPEHREATKIGGLPYWPSGLAWPLSSNGKPLTFVAQINFSSSRDIVSDLPADVLLVFGDEHAPSTEQWHLEWQPVGITTLIDAADVPKTDWHINPCFGYRCRYTAFPNARVVGPPQGFQFFFQSANILTCQATQIGAAPFPVQAYDECLIGHTLCTISSVSPDLFEPHPWVNVPTPLCRQDEIPPLDRGNLCIVDMGCIYVLRDDNGRFYTHTSYY